MMSLYGLAVLLVVILLALKLWFAWSWSRRFIGVDPPAAAAS